jgi:hypothetical protein
VTPGIALSRVGCLSAPILLALQAPPPGVRRADGAIAAIHLVGGGHL